MIEYSIDDGADPDNLDRLFCTITDPEAAPTSELATLYSQRWEIESVFDELKIHLNESRRVLRSQSPRTCLSRHWAKLALHWAIRALMCAVAGAIGRDPDRLSFVGSLRGVRRATTASPGFSPLTLAKSFARAIAEIVGQILPPRRLRYNPWVI